MISVKNKITVWIIFFTLFNFNISYSNEKIDAVIDQIQLLNEKGAPILVGTTSVEKSEVISKDSPYPLIHDFWKNKGGGCL